MALTVSVMTGGVNNHPTTSEEANGIATDFVSEGIIGAYTNTSGVAPATGAFAVNAQGTPDMTVAVSAGVAYVTGTPSSQNSQTFRVYNSASENVTIAANSSGSTKYDWVYIKLDATLLNAPTLAGTTTATLVTSRSTSNSTDDGTPPTYGYPIAVVTVANGASTITNSVIRDARNNANIGTVTGTSTGWVSNALPAVSSVTENGNRSADITFASTVASLLTPGMRLRTSRTVAAPTYMGGAFNGTNHYFTKTTPTSTLSTVTDNFTLMGHGELTAYGTSAILARSDTLTNNGIFLYTNTSGQVICEFTNGATANFRRATTYQSVPLNKKVHVAASYTSTATTFVIYIDGISVPFTMTSGGTNPTVAGTGGDFSIGRFGANNGGYWTGYISGVGVFNAVLSAATIRSYKNQVLSGSETNCIGAWSLNNTGVNQQAAGTNDLTAMNSVGYTVRSPYTTDANGTPGGTYDYAIVTKVSTTTATVQYPEGCAIPTSGGISTVDLATTKAPFGFPAQQDRWEVAWILKTQNNTGAVGSNVVTNLISAQLNVPVGQWDLGFDMCGQITHAGASFLQQTIGLSTSNSSFTDYELVGGLPAISASLTEVDGRIARRKKISISTATPYYLLTTAALATTTQYFNGTTTNGASVINAIPAHL